MLGFCRDYNKEPLAVKLFRGVQKSAKETLAALDADNAPETRWDFTTTLSLYKFRVPLISY